MIKKLSGIEQFSSFRADENRKEYLFLPLRFSVNLGTEVGCSLDLGHIKDSEAVIFKQFKHTLPGQILICFGIKNVDNPV